MPNQLLSSPQNLINDHAHNGKDKDKKLILWFSDVGIGDVGLVGGKNASLGEMYQNLRDI